MLGSTVLEVAVGLTFCYATLALTVSSVQEALASALRLRAHTLLDGIKSMLNDPEFTGLARDLYSHALVNPHDDGQAANQGSLKSKPSYVEPMHFAIALVDAIQSVPGNYAQLGRDIDAIGDPQVRAALAGIYQRTGGNLAAFQDGVAGWFNSAMERVSGSYKRRSLLVSLLLSLLFAIVFNIDSIHLFRSLWHYPAVAAQISAAPSSIDQRTLALLFTLPIGWSKFPPVFDQAFLLQVAGWLITASTALFGAPFWFDMLQRTMQLRGTGNKPDEKSPPMTLKVSASTTTPAADGRR
ncbi:hypothetical protein [Massilia psychrophila]|uniref:hypothetical protein n=1 Tax=Massilia psychrophila TaxID=1603353 RepID=UPI0015D4B638|nr:hypothetical protein [Massilia psychrophila]GGE74790.1 hypothetical protein GCM10008020_19340 [Massilia psychrophila]